MSNLQAVVFTERARAFLELDTRLREQREAEITELAHDVGSRVVELVGSVVQGGEYPEELRPLTAHEFYRRDGHDYAGRTLKPANPGGFEYRCSDDIVQARVMTDLQIATLYMLGGSAPQWLVTDIMKRPPISVMETDIVSDFDAISYEPDNEIVGGLRLDLRESR